VGWRRTSAQLVAVSFHQSWVGLFKFKTKKKAVGGCVGESRSEPLDHQRPIVAEMGSGPPVTPPGVRARRKKPFFVGREISAPASRVSGRRPRPAAPLFDRRHLTTPPPTHPRPVQDLAALVFQRPSRASVGHRPTKATAISFARPGRSMPPSAFFFVLQSSPIDNAWRRPGKMGERVWRSH